MRETLYIHLSGTDGAAWRVGGPIASGTATGHGTLEDAVAQCEGRRVVLIVPGIDVLLCAADLPNLGGQKLRQALPYALEDELAEDVDVLHFALGARDADGKRAVAVAARRHMEAWLAPFQENGIEPDAIHPETLCIPYPEEESLGWALLLDGERVLVRTGTQSGFACEAGLLADMAALGPLPEDLPVVIYIPEGEDERARALVGPLAASDVQIRVYSEPLARLAEGLDKHTIDLRQGDYAIRHGWQRWGLPFRATAILAGVLFAIYIATQVVSYAHLSHESKALHAQAQQKFQSLFPHVTRIEDIRAQTKEHLATLRNAGGADTGLFFLLESTVNVLKSTSNLEVRGMQYHGKALFLHLRGKDLSVLETLRKQFSVQSGVALDIQSANAGEDGVDIRLRIGGTAT
jgi:general secretion pathway protein L